MRAGKQRALLEALDEYLAEQDQDAWCMRVKHGQCSIRRCLLGPDGKVPPVPFSYDVASCPRYRVEQARAAIAGDAPSNPLRPNSISTLPDRKGVG